MNKIVEELSRHRQITICFSQSNNIVSLEIDTAQLDAQERTDLVMGLYRGITETLKNCNEKKQI